MNRGTAFIQLIELSDGSINMNTLPATFRSGFLLSEGKECLFKNKKRPFQLNETVFLKISGMYKLNSQQSKTGHHRFLTNQYLPVLF